VESLIEGVKANVKWIGLNGLGLAVRVWG